jgi:hypothetical protein
MCCDGEIREIAGAIVDHFGAEQVFAEPDRRPERLPEVRTKAGRAISRKSVERAIAAWREVTTIREVEATSASPAERGLGRHHRRTSRDHVRTPMSVEKR